ncbi:hypothetical protein HZC09_04935 [Candidatus Micrarchaeota archaeon]|nr:hypothetical protein [Candidatus Micrarchaeota archaeon]
MKTTIEITGFWDEVLQRAVDVGLARSKTDALRIGVIELNHHYNLLEDDEAELVIRKIERTEADNRAKGLKPKTLADVLKEYPELKKVKG